MAGMGYTEARRLMKEKDWKMRLKLVDGNVIDRITLFDPNYIPFTEYTVRIDSGHKLTLECVEESRIGEYATLAFNHNSFKRVYRKP